MDSKKENYIHNVNNESSLFVSEPQYSWGGQWTEDKLDVFEKFAKAYLVIMNKYREPSGWKLIYFDGFAGSGSRQEKNKSELEQTLFEYDYFLERDDFSYKGAAERVLNIEGRGFDYYYFVEKNAESCRKLQEKLGELPHEGELIFRINDANNEIQRLATKMRNNHNLAALALLDPFGMQIDWDSINKLKGLRIDLWILVPTGIIINRLLDRKGKLQHIEKLTTFFGEPEKSIRSYFFKTHRQTTLFEEVEVVEKVNNSISRIAELYLEKLGKVFSEVISKPLVLYNTRKIPIFHFIFASNNKTATKIASDIIRKKIIKG